MTTIGPMLGVSKCTVDQMVEPLPIDPATPPFTENARPRVRRAEHYECGARPFDTLDYILGLEMRCSNRHRKNSRRIKW